MTTNEPLKPEVNFVWRYIINITLKFCMNNFVYVNNYKHGVYARLWGYISHKCNIIRICTSGNYDAHKWIMNWIIINLQSILVSWHSLKHLKESRHQKIFCFILFIFLELNIQKVLLLQRSMFCKGSVKHVSLPCEPGFIHQRIW